MSGNDRALRILLLVFGVAGLPAFAAMLMPMAWMDAVHRWLGLGELPGGATVEYLARSLSAFYGFFSVVCLLLAIDVAYYRRLIFFGGLLIAALGIALAGIDLTAGLPWWWTIAEGPTALVVGVAITYLAREPTRPSGSD